MMREVVAAFTFFTRLPLWRVCRAPAGSFRHVIAWWPLTGLLTGGLMTAVYLSAVYLRLHPAIAVLLAYAGRLLLTGALHEDGLADFFDGFGGGRTREQTLSIMKDSRTGSYGVLGLTLYVALWACSAFVLTQSLKGCEYAVFLTCDVWSKWCASQITNLLPYARKKEESKMNTVYERMSPARFTAGFVFGILPFAALSAFGRQSCGTGGLNGATMAFTGPATATANPVMFFAGAIAPLAVALLLALYMKRRIRGYTGDCCGATFLLCELSYLLTLNCLWKFF
jgi:adenosylcobinamide-GDP ribazoletransferase